ncbi:MAG: filamentous hemagglutinin N-terminal domain-containing protein, partial [Gallionella sp.]
MKNHIVKCRQQNLTVEQARNTRPLKHPSLKNKLLITALALAFSPLALAGPLDGQVTQGSGSINQSGAITNITQTSAQLSLNWGSFNVGANETVNFMQPSASSVVLNRVLSQDASTILGNLNANGQVFIINPNGVLFGSTAQVNVGGLVASTLNISDADFNTGNYQFSTDGTAGEVTNQGNLSAAEGGYIALIAPKVINQGNITANSGSVLMAAGDQVTLNINNGSLIGYTVDQGSLDALADNKQLIQADGGQIILTAKAADALSTAVVNNSGIIQARTVQNVGGVIKLMGDMDTGTVNVGGTLDASAPAVRPEPVLSFVEGLVEGQSNGGFIETSAAHVKVQDGAQITTASGNGLTGSWLIDPVDFTIAATGGDISGTTLTTNLGTANVTIISTSGGVGTAGDVNVNDTVTWSANTLTLNAQNNININTAMNGSGTAGLALEYGQQAVNAGNLSTYNINAPINLASTGSFTTKIGSDDSVISYTIIDALGAALSTTGTDLQGMNGNLAGNYVLGADIDATST